MESPVTGKLAQIEPKTITVSIQLKIKKPQKILEKSPKKIRKISKICYLSPLRFRMDSPKGISSRAQLYRGGQL